MRILQLDVNSIDYEMIKPEARVYEDVTDREVSLKNALVAMTSIERGDSEESVAAAVRDMSAFMEKQKIGLLVIYPFAHLSNNLEASERAMALLAKMRQGIEDRGIKVVAAPFGWNKKLNLDIKGHPLAETSRSYSNSGAVQKAERNETVEKPKTDEGKYHAEVREDNLFSRIRKSDWSGLPDTDHRTIGERLDLFSFQEVSPGMVYWHKNGRIVYNKILEFLRGKLEQQDYAEVSTPTLANLALWHVSGHISHYKQNMFVFDSESEDLGMKPMNCPSTILIYRSKKWSYRELPFRTAIFDRLYRNEISGALTGLFRVRELTQDDGHIFITEDQLEGEMKLLLSLVKEVYDTFGMTYAAKLSTMPEDHMGDEALWEKATSALRRSLELNGLPYTINEGDGAFYGPKIDFDVTDAMGRKWQCATIQVDYQLPLRFKLEYTGEDGQQHTPIMVHRAILGSLERFIGILTEHYQGKFPAWLAPVQVRILSISEQANAYAREVHEKLRARGIRCELDASDRTIEYKVRDAQLLKVPYMLIVGKKEMEANTVAVRTRSGKQKFGVSVDKFTEELGEETLERRSSGAYEA
jgi:threonyl-tRNA synthetase